MIYLDNNYATVTTARHNDMLFHHGTKTAEALCFEIHRRSRTFTIHRGVDAKQYYHRLQRVGGVVA